MNVAEAVELGEILLGEFGLYSWAIALDRSKVRFGQCRHRNHTIGLSKALVELNAREDVEDTIRHEIAHALCGVGAGHGRAWKSMCYRVGARPQTCYDSNKVVAAPAPWALVCPTDGYRHPRHRRTARKYVHRCGTVMVYERTIGGN